MPRSPSFMFSTVACIADWCLHIAEVAAVEDLLRERDQINNNYLFAYGIISDREILTHTIHFHHHGHRRTRHDPLH